jgi:hypothetical protein
VSGNSYSDPELPPSVQTPEQRMIANKLVRLAQGFVLGEWLISE